MEEFWIMGTRKFLLKKELNFYRELIYYTIYGAIMSKYTLFSNKSSLVLVKV